MSESGIEHTEPLYYVRQALRYADDPDEFDILVDAHKEIVDLRSEDAEDDRDV